MPEFLPNIMSPFSCGGCSPIDNISKIINPLSGIADQINPLSSFESKTTSCTFRSFFHRGTTPLSGFILPTQAEWDEIESWLIEMDNLASSTILFHGVLRCMLEWLCLCQPEITVRMYKGTPDPNIPTSKGSFAKTGWVQDLQNPRKFNMNFNFDMIKEPNEIRAGQLVYKVWRKKGGIDLLNNNTNIGYFPILPDPHFSIGFIVHELGHILDKFYWNNDPDFNKKFFASGSHVHAYMWQSFYFQSFYLGSGSNSIDLGGTYELFNLDGQNCDNDIINKLDLYPAWPQPLDPN